MLEEALGSRSKVRLIRALVARGQADATNDDLVQATGQSTGTIVPALQQLVLAGVVEATSGPRGKSYRLSATHPLAPTIRRAILEETAAIDRVCDSIVRRSRAAQLRFAAWSHGERQNSEGTRSVVVLLCIATDVKTIEALVAEAARTHSLFLEARCMAEADARAALAAGDPEFLRLVEHGRVVHADAAWLA